MSAGLRLVLAVAIPFAGAAICYELRARTRWALGAALVTVAACAALAASLLPAVTGGAVESRLGGAIPGVDVTARADSASVAIILTGCVAAALAIPRQRSGARLAGVLLCLAGLAFTAAAANLALLSGGVSVIAAGTFMVRGRHGPGSRSAALLAFVIAAAGLALMASAAQLVATAGTSDLSFIPATAIGNPSALPWAIAGALLVTSLAIPGEGASPARDWAAVGALPAGYLVLLRLQQATGGQSPGVTSAVLGACGVGLAALALVTGRRAATVAPVARAAVAVLGGVLVGLPALGLSATGTLWAGLFLFLEVSLLAAPAWDRRPTAWSAAAVAALALPGGGAFAVTVTAAGAVAHRGVSAFAFLVALAAAVTGAAVLGARAVAAPPAARHPRIPGTVLAVAAGVAGGLVPGLALRLAAAPLAGGAASVDVDPGAIGIAGGGAAAGYLAIAAGVLLVAVASALVVAGDTPLGVTVAAATPVSLPPVRPLLRARRRLQPAWRRFTATAAGLDGWLEAQPGVALVLGVTAVALLVIR